MNANRDVHPTPDDNERLQDAGNLAAAAVARLEQRGLIDRDDQGLATLSVDGITTLHDAVVLLALNTTGPNLPDEARFVHDIGAIYGQALSLWMFAGDTDAATLAGAKRDAIGALKRAAREHTY